MQEIRSVCGGLTAQAYQTPEESKASARLNAADQSQTLSYRRYQCFHFLLKRGHMAWHTHLKSSRPYTEHLLGLILHFRVSVSYRCFVSFSGIQPGEILDAPARCVATQFGPLPNVGHPNRPLTPNFTSTHACSNSSRDTAQVATICMNAQRMLLVFPLNLRL